MPKLSCTARRVGDFESRTEEYELTFALENGAPRELRIKYQAARAYEISAALDDATETARGAIADTAPEMTGKPTDESLAKFSWRTLQSVKYDEGEPKTSYISI